ncbi:phosphatidylserine decarboxylase-domain-containing protein [Pisolithus orientalis]|uniref:phosphatidylserine decarboxylase-domain-containing protein n=1 Tax=Pisolithus orientalis TaxID=936130 RepID=UPI00222557F1|nr:phosphatidylserine decarboxylase-domain-containing protein [Pisolithus orientalis]KAI5997796.1 phosphatidylserine decarboxylase-domain-containing protein [Pisolithus orientalis]
MPAAFRGWTHHLFTLPRARPSRDKKCSDDRPLAPVIQEFQQLIEDDPELFMYFHTMFDEVRRPNGDIGYVSWRLQGVNERRSTALSLRHPDSVVSITLSRVFPMYAVLAPFCNTPSGYSIFTNPKVNAQLHKIFDVWAAFLVSPESRYVLTTNEKCWFSPVAIDVMSQRLGTSFYDAWVCRDSDPDKHYGFTSWDDFFTRRFRPHLREVIDPDNPDLITAPCEAYFHTIRSNVRAVDKFWIKGNSYSLSHVFNHDPFTPLFVGGTVYQGILSSLDYHRWHSPVDGVVRKTRLIPGTYYAARLDNNRDPDIVSRSQDFVTAIAARALIFIESDNPMIGLMCFVAVGLGEVSTCEITVKEGDRLKKGDELGSFHFGGSTHCLVFRPQVSLKPFPSCPAGDTAERQ